MRRSSNLFVVGMCVGRECVMQRGEGEGAGEGETDSDEEKGV